MGSSAGPPSRAGLRFSAEDEAFRTEVRDWLTDNLVDEFRALGARGGPGSEHEGFDVRLAWERRLGEAGWTGLGRPQQHGGRGATLTQQGFFNEGYVRAGAPARVGIVRE